MNIPNIDPTSAAQAISSTKPDTFTKVKTDSVEQRDGRKVAEEFTALFTNILVKEMWNASSTDGKGPFGDGPGADIYRGMAEGALSEAIAKSGMEGLVDRIEELIQSSQKNDPKRAQDGRIGPDQEGQAGPLEDGSRGVDGDITKREGPNFLPSLPRTLRED